MTRKIILIGALATGAFIATPLHAGVVVRVSLGSQLRLAQYRHGDPRITYRIALEHGTEDGQRKGYEDARKRRSFDVERHGWYRDGDRGYEHRYGPRWDYVRGYRRGFEQAYEEAYWRARGRHERRDWRDDR